ncbi:hypothetical protein BV394_03420 [Brevirhabdus pacifica]|uniref:Uncharacterized protein n=2 Tax=Brevirhabdus pacifica TaxID=1267768 RepID=A0A1U7DG26_9RHOB|nr:hypothetical protein BV394_03420 [Brevirhabdus pacifica]OWU80126.1 hypothetical protein ATO5_04105 [Loktanella sp. 22II-4b]PJJ86560.1 hypothetical protein CLV77_1109 [Brevirhabdus pacifica]
MPDRYSSTFANLSSPAIDAFAITPDDATDLPEITRALYIGIGGDLSVVTKEGGSVTLVNLLAGTVLPIRVRAVRATGSTAQSVVGLV